MMKRKLHSQALCVQGGVKLQRDLAATLDRLLALNPKAQALRRARQAAEAAVTAARTSLHPGAIAAAEAVRTAVILQQMALRARQTELIAHAQMQRTQHERELQRAVKPWIRSTVDSQRFFPTALAVRPQPLGSLSPDYVPVVGFERWQQHQFSFETELSPPFLQWDVRQLTRCSVSLTGKEKAWRPRIVAASALSRPRWRL